MSKSLISKPWRTRIVQTWRAYAWAAWAVLGVLALLVLALGYVGFERQSAATNAGRTPLDNLYLALLLFFFNPAQNPGVGPYLEAARYLAILVAAGAVFKTLRIVFNEQVQAFELSLVKDHVIICGLGDKGLLLAQSFRNPEDAMTVVVVEADQNHQSLSAVREAGALVCIGDASTKEILTKARVQRAKYLIAVCDQDDINADIAAQTLKLLDEQASKLRAPKRRARKLLCIVHLVDDNLRDLLEEAFVGQGQSDSCRLEFFNVYDSGSSTLLKQHPTALVYEPEPHILLIGLGLLGQNFLERALRERQRSAGGRERLRVTVVDPQATEKMKTLFHRAHLAPDLCELVKHDMDARSPAFERAQWLRDDSGVFQTPTVAYICLEEDNLTLAVGLRLCSDLQQAPCRVVMCLQGKSDLPSLLDTSRHAGNENPKYDGLKIFNLLKGVCNTELVRGGTTEMLAKAIHAHYCNPQLAPKEWEELWEKLSEMEQEINRCPADHIGIKLHSIGCGIVPLADDDKALSFQFSADEINKLALMEHERWWEEKHQAGFTQGKKDEDQKKHPDCCHWDDLGAEAQEKNRRHIEALPKILYSAGYQIRRLHSTETTP